MYLEIIPSKSEAITSIIKEVNGFKSKAITFLLALTASKALVALPRKDPNIVHL